MQQAHARKDHAQLTYESFHQYRMAGSVHHVCV